jgi:AraC-like DNA-binding protein
VAGARFTVTGPSALATRFELGATRMWGIGLLPLGWARLVRRPASQYANLLADAERHPGFARFAALAGVFDGKADDEAEYARIIALLHGFDAPVPAPECARIRAVHAAMVELGLASVEEFAELAGLSVRALERTCRRHFGFPPKLLLRRQRFMRSLAAWMLGGMGRWSPAIDELYTDQAHFNRDFHAFMGMGPSEYAALPHPILSAFMAQRAKTWGSPAQTLDRPGSHPTVPAARVAAPSP